MAEEGDNKAESGGKNPLLTVVLILNIIMMGGVAFLQFQTHKKMSSQPSMQDVVKAEMKKIEGEDDQKSETGEAKEQSGKLFPLDGFTANLAQGDGPRRFIRLNAVLKLSSEAKEEEYKARKPQIRDAIISILNSKRPQDLLKGQGKEYLKEEIKSSINTFLVEGKVLDVYYVGFQVN
jgi:flagellar FliL protein